MDVVIAVIIAALSGMGVGGGGLFALYLKMFSDYSQLEIQAINLVFFFFAASASLILHLMRRRIYLTAVALMLTAGVVGSLTGSALALVADGALLSRLFGGIMIAAGLYSLFGKK